MNSTHRSLTAVNAMVREGLDTSNRSDVDDEATLRELISD